MALEEKRAERKRLLEEKRRLADLKEKEKQRRKRKARESRGKKIIVAVVLLFIFVFTGSQLYSAYKINSDYKKVLLENKNLKEEKKSLEEELRHVNEPEYVEQQARDQLKMIKPGEVMYILPEEHKAQDLKEEKDSE